jgi:hypothetical protein
MNWEKLAQNRIEEAIAQGEFDDLPGRGQPLNLDEYFSLPPAERAGAALLRNAGVAPPEVELLKSATLLEAALEGCTDPSEQARLRWEIEERKVALALGMERRRCGGTGAD